jgi:hypothetical protein
MASLVPRDVVDIQLHDTQYIIPALTIDWLLAAVLFLMWCLYKVLNKVLWKRILSWLHVWCTILFFAMLYLLTNFGNLFTPLFEQKIYAYNTFDDFNQRILPFFYILVLLLILGQLVFITNVVVGTIMKAIKKRPSA